jgi:hypothetical protein
LIIDSAYKLIYTEAMEENKNATPAPVAQVSTLPPPPSVTSIAINKMPSFGALYVDAWELLKHAFVSLIKLFFITTLSIGAVVAVILLFAYLGSLVADKMGYFALLLK